MRKSKFRFRFSISKCEINQISPAKLFSTNFQFSPQSNLGMWTKVHVPSRCLSRKIIVLVRDPRTSTAIESEPVKAATLHLKKHCVFNRPLSVRDLLEATEAHITAHNTGRVQAKVRGI